MTLIYATLFCRDNVPTLKLASWPLYCEMFDGDIIAGPVRISVPK